MKQPEEIFTKYFEQFRYNLMRASLEHYLETGTISGSLLLEVRSMFKEWDKQKKLQQHNVMQAEGSDGAKGASVGQRSVGTNAEAVAFNCVSSESLVYNRPCKEWCGNPYCKSEAPSGGHL